MEVEFADGNAPRAGDGRVGRVEVHRPPAVRRAGLHGRDPLTVTVDPTQSIDEYDYANNALTMPCPAPA